MNQPNNQALTPQVIQRALDTIVLNQSFDGTWRDFDIPGMGMSSGWVTAHVALKPADLPPPWDSLVEKSVCSVY